jgi:hypothetical protein
MSKTSPSAGQVRFVHGDFFGEIFMLIFSIDKVQIRVNLKKNGITFPRQSLFEIKQQLTEDQYHSLMKQLYSYIFDLN